MITTIKQFCKINESSNSRFYQVLEQEIANSKKIMVQFFPSVISDAMNKSGTKVGNMNEKLKALKEKHAQELRELELENSFGFIPMELEESIMIISKRHNIKFKDVLGILNALVDAGVTIEELEITPSKSGSAHQNKLAYKTKEIWIKASPKYKGLLLGNMYYSTLKDIIMFGILKKYIPYRKYQKN